MSPVPGPRHCALFQKCPFCETCDHLKLEKSIVLIRTYGEASKELQKRIGIRLQNFSLFVLESEDYHGNVESNTTDALREAEQSGSNLSSIDLEFEEHIPVCSGRCTGKGPRAENGSVLGHDC